MGQHSNQPSRQNPLGRIMAPGKRRLTAVAAGAAVIAAASTTAWAAVSNGDEPRLTAAATLPSASPSTPQSGSAPKPASDQASPTPSDSPTPSESPTPSPAKSKAEAGGEDAEKTSTPKPKSTPSPKEPKPAAKPKVRVLSTGTCGASYYGEPQMTASGERFNPSAMTAAHKSSRWAAGSASRTRRTASL